MATEADAYRQLQKHLDTMPVGYPATDSGVEIRLLKKIFWLRNSQNYLL